MSGKRRGKNEAADADVDRKEEGRGSSGPGTRRSGVSEAKQKFLAAHQFGASVVEAARLAGVHPRTPYRWRDHDPEFAQAFREARDGLVEGLEWEAFRRAINGNDRLLMFLLKSFKPDTYRGRGSPGVSKEGKGSKGNASLAAQVLELAEKVRGWM